MKLRKKLAANPFYKRCARNEALDDHQCQPDPRTGRMIEWEHALIHAGCQVQLEFAIVPLCWWAHRGPGLVKEKNIWIALNRATDNEIVSISKAQDYFQYRAFLNKKYGPYIESAKREVGVEYQLRNAYSL